METQYFKDYSPALGREMESKLYGYAGRPVLFLPSQDGRFFDFADLGMAAALSRWIDAGEMMVLSIDTLDRETWSDAKGDPYWRIRRYEQWVRYVLEEAGPKLRHLACEYNDWDGQPGILPFGCGLGACHAVNLYLRYPQVFDGCLALSGVYTARYGFGEYMDPVVYQNSPLDYMSHFPGDHPYMELYRKKRAVLCCGQGAGEQPDSTRRLGQLLQRLNIPVWADLWGADVSCGWTWWHKQAAYFIPCLLGA